MTFPQIIRSYLEATKESEKDLAKRLKVKEIDVNNWVKGLGLPQWKDRNQILRTLRFIDTCDDTDGFHFQGITKVARYNINHKEEYYKSDTWKQKEIERFNLDNYTCQLCGFRDDTETGKNLNCHHLLYSSNFGGAENVELELITLCDDCHKRVHQKKATKKLLKEREDKNYKLLIIDKANGTHDIKIFTEKITDKQINLYVKKLEHKFKFKYKSYDIISIDGNDAIDSNKLNWMLNN